jgi:hypothetical protein
MKKSDRCLEELRQLIGIAGISPAMGFLAREKALEIWIDRWVYELDHEESYIKFDFSDEEKAAINNHSINIIVDKLMEDGVKVEDDSKKLRLKVRVLRY